ncbi:hypothetical protein D3C83_188170 [compost metagenome]
MLTASSRSLALVVRPLSVNQIEPKDRPMKKPCPAVRKTLSVIVDSLTLQAEPSSSVSFLLASAKVAPASTDFMMFPRSPVT